MTLYKYDGTPAAATPNPPNTQSLPGGLGAKGSLTGTGGNDGLNGGAGVTMSGLGGDDTFWVLSPQDRVVERPGGGVDQIIAYRNINLGDYANVENLQVQASGTIGIGTGGDNVITGGDGMQQLYGGGGQDVLIGGSGPDVFVVYKGEGNDVIQDFNPGEGDAVRLKAGFTSFAQLKPHLSQAGADVRLDLGGGDGLIFRNLRVSDLGAQSFQLQFDKSGLGALTFDDEFNGPLSIWDAAANPGGKWRPSFGGNPQSLTTYNLNNELEVYTSPYFRGAPGNFPDTPFTINPDGTLSITARPSSNPQLFGKGYISGLLDSAASQVQTYGYFEIRARPPTEQGTWAAFWLAAADGTWPPEVDIMETWDAFKHSSLTVEHSGVNGHDVSQLQNQLVPDTPDGFHTYGLLWTPQELTWTIDGVEVWQTATPADMHKPMHMILNLALTNKDGPVGAAPMSLDVDYVRAYAIPGITVTGPGGPNVGVIPGRDGGDAGSGSGGGAGEGPGGSSGNPSDGSGQAGHLGDVTGDGRADLVFEGSGGGLTIWASQGGTPTFSASAAGSLSANLTPQLPGQAQDFNGDGLADLLFERNDGQMQVWLAQAGGGFAARSLPSGRDMQLAGAGDFDGDGVSDLLWRRGDGDLIVWKHPGTGTFAREDLGVVDPARHVAAVADFNGDGRADILFATAAGEAQLGLSTDAALAFSNLGSFGPGWQVAGAADFNGDGKADILLRSASGADNLWLSRPGDYAHANIGAQAVGWSVHTVGDFNGDGRADILWSDGGGHLSLWTYNGGASFTHTSLPSVSSDWHLL